MAHGSPHASVELSEQEITDSLLDALPWLQNQRPEVAIQLGRHCTVFEAKRGQLIFRQGEVRLPTHLSVLLPSRCFP